MEIYRMNYLSYRRMSRQDKWELYEFMQAEIYELKTLLEAKDYAIDCAIDLVEKTEVEGFYATSEVYTHFKEALKPFMPDVQTVNKSK